MSEQLQDKQLIELNGAVPKSAGSEELIRIIRVFIIHEEEAIDFRAYLTTDEEINRWVELLKPPKKIMLWRAGDYAKLFSSTDIIKVIIGAEQDDEYMYPQETTPTKRAKRTKWATIKLIWRRKWSRLTGDLP